MHLYTPIDGRSLVVKEYVISSTGMQFDEPVPCLEELVGILLARESTDEAAEKTETEYASEDEDTSEI